MKEYEACWTIKGSSKNIIAMTLEGCVMRISDVIAYIGRDLEDAITIGLIKRTDIPEKVRSVIGDNNGSIINSIILDLINNSFENDYIKLSDEIFEAIQCFYDFSYKAIYKNPKQTTQDAKIRNMFLNKLSTPKAFFNMLDYQFVHSVQKSKLTVPEFEARKADYLENADAMIVLYAYTQNKLGIQITVVSEESSAGNDDKMFKKIPSICNILEIDCISLPDLMKIFEEIEVRF